jgi:hypothetical protein
MRFTTRTAVALLALATGSQLVSASVFRGATGSYSIKPETCFTGAAPTTCTVDFVYTSAWRESTNTARFSVEFGDRNEAVTTVTDSTVVTTGGDTYKVFVSTVSHTYQSRAVFLAGIFDCCRISGLENTDSDEFIIKLSVDLTTTPTPLQSPVISSALLLPAAIGSDFVTTLPVAAVGAFTCRYVPDTCQRVLRETAMRFFFFFSFF